MVCCSKNRRIQYIPLQVLFLIVGIVLCNQPLVASSKPVVDSLCTVAASTGVHESIATSVSLLDYDHSYHAQNEYDCTQQNSAIVPVSYSFAATLASESSISSGHTLSASLARLYDHEYDDDVFCVFTECLVAPRSVDDLLDMSSNAKKLKGGKVQKVIQGDGESMFKSIAQGGDELASGAVKLPDGTIVNKHISTTTGQVTIDVNRGGSIYKIRVDP